MTRSNCSSRTTSMSFQDSDRKELQKMGEDDSMTWQTYAVKKLDVLEIVIKDMVQQNPPNQLLKMANAILKTLWGINSLKSKKDFERLLGEASTLVVTIWQFYTEKKAKYPTLKWPPPKLKDLLEKLVDATCCIHKLMERKSEKNLAKRVLLGCFGIRDLGKFNKYQQRLGEVALGLQGKPHNMEFHAVLLAVVHSRTLPQDEDSDSESAGELVEGDLTDSAKTKAADKKHTVEGSRLPEVGKSTTVKPTNQRVKSEEDSPRKSCKAKNEAKDNSKHERSAEDKPARRIDRRAANCDEDRKKTMRYESDEADLVDRTPAQGSRSAQSRLRKKPSQAYEDDKFKDTAPKQKSRSRTIPVPSQTPSPPPRHQATISDFNFTNGSGTMINENVGNIYNLNTSE